MRKLILAMVAAVFWFAAQAAAYSWSGMYVADGYNGNGESSVAAQGATAYLLVSGYSLNPGGSAIIAASGYTYSAIAEALATDTLGVATLEAAAIGKTTVVGDEGIYNGLTGDLTGLANDTTYKFYSIIVSADGKYALNIGSKDITTDPLSGEAQFAAGDLWDKTSAQGGWYTTAAVPEPTSGLLILIGMASLALRRRSA